MAKRKTSNVKKYILIGLGLFLVIIMYMVFSTIKQAKKVIPVLTGYDRSINRASTVSVFKTHLDWSKNPSNANLQPDRAKWAKAIGYNPYIAWLQSKFV